jgi:hypothetical protein
LKVGGIINCVTYVAICKSGTNLAVGRRGQSPTPRAVSPVVAPRRYSELEIESGAAFPWPSIQVREPLSRLVMHTFSHTLAIEHVGSWHLADIEADVRHVRSPKVKRTWPVRAPMSANDPKQTLPGLRKRLQRMPDEMISTMRAARPTTGPSLSAFEAGTERSR